MNRTDLARQSLPVPRSGSRRRFATCVAMILIGGSLVWIFAPEPRAKPEVVILPPNYSIPPQQRPIPDRWLPNSPAWPRKLCFALLGKPVNVQFDLEMLRFRGNRSLQTTLNNRTPLVTSNGVRAWILPDHEMKLIAARLETEAEERHSAKIITRPGMPSTLSMGLPKIAGASFTPGDTISYTTRHLANAVELIGTFVMSEVATNAHWRAPDASEPVTLETNLMIAAKMQIPTGHSVFLYDTNRTDARGTTAGMLIRWRTTGPPPQASGRSMQPLK